MPDCKLLLLCGEDKEDGGDGNDYSISSGKNVHDGDNEKNDATDTKAFKSAKKVYYKYLNLHKRNVQAGGFHHSSTNDDYDDEDNDDYSDEENYDYSDEESYVDVNFSEETKKEIKKEIEKDVEIPKKCKRPDVCYIMKLCLYCKPFFKKQLKNG